MPRCLSEGVDIFLKSVKRQGESGHDVRVSRSAPWMARVGDPVMMGTTVSLFIRKFTPGDATSRRDVPFVVGVRGFFTKSQFSSPRQACAVPLPPALWSGSGCHGFPVLRRLRRSSEYHPGIRSLLPSIHNDSKVTDRSPVPA